MNLGHPSLIGLFGLPRCELNVYVAIWSFRNNETRRCFPSIARIMLRSGRKEKAVKAARNSLREKGHLDWETLRRKCYYWFPEIDDFGVVRGPKKGS